MEKRILLWVIIGLLFLAVLFLAFKAGAGGTVVQSAGTAAKSTASYNSMVGGC